MQEKYWLPRKEARKKVARDYGIKREEFVAGKRPEYTQKSMKESTQKVVRK